MTQRNQKGSEAELNVQAEYLLEHEKQETAKLRKLNEQQQKEIQELQHHFDSLDSAYQKLQNQYKETKRGRKRWKKKYTQLCIRNVEKAQ